MTDGESLCAACARSEYHLIVGAVRDRDTRSGWHPAGVDVHWEGEPLICAHCNAPIPSAYGVPDNA